MLYELIDDCLCSGEITMLLNLAIKLCPAMRRNNAKIYPANIRNIFPNCSKEFADLGAWFINEVAFDW